MGESSGKSMEPTKREDDTDGMRESDRGRGVARRRSESASLEGRFDYMYLDSCTVSKHGN